MIWPVGENRDRMPMSGLAGEIADAMADRDRVLLQQSG